jgi:acetyl esterase/lipase
MSTKDVLDLPVLPPDHRISYGPHPLQFGDLRIPKGEGRFPAVIVVHGGCWQSEYSLDHISSFCAALTEVGLATWSLEYRRIGDEGGGWPGTFEDVAVGTDHLRELAKSFPIDVNKAVAVGHSAGGHLALWLAARHQLADEDFAKDPLPIAGVVALAGISDLQAAFDEEVCGDSVSRLLGGTPSDCPNRYRMTSPAALLPLGVPQRLVHGSLDDIVPLHQSRRFAEAAKAKGDVAEMVICLHAGHFELIAPSSSAWPAVRDAIVSLSRDD